MKYLNNFTSIKKELANHIIDKVNNGFLTNINIEDWHYFAFNEDYYIIGYYNATQWLKNHDINPFEAVGICQDYELETFGEQTKKYNNAETTVNMLVYILGEELLNSDNFENIKALKIAMNKIINE